MARTGFLASAQECVVRAFGLGTGVWWLLGCRCSEPLPPALADGLDGRGRAADNPRLVARGQASSQGWRQNKFCDVRHAVE